MNRSTKMILTWAMPALLIAMFPWAFSMVHPTSCRQAEDRFPVVLRGFVYDDPYEVRIQRIRPLVVPSRLRPLFLMAVLVTPRGYLLAEDLRSRLHRFSYDGEWELTFKDPPRGVRFFSGSSSLSEDGTVLRGAVDTTLGEVLSVRYGLDGSYISAEREPNGVIPLTCEMGSRWFILENSAIRRNGAGVVATSIQVRPDGNQLAGIYSPIINQDGELLFIDYHYEGSIPCLGAAGDVSRCREHDRSVVLCKYSAEGEPIGQWTLPQELGVPSQIGSRGDEIVVVYEGESLPRLFVMNQASGAMRSLNIGMHGVRGRTLGLHLVGEAGFLLICGHPPRLFEFEIK